MSEIRKPVVFVGFSAEAIPGIEDYLEQPEAPSNYGEEAAQKWRQTKGAEMLHKAAASLSLCKLAGHITDIVAVDPVRGKVFQSAEGDAGSVPSVKFLNWLAAANYLASEVVLFGFHIREFVRVSGVEAILAGIPVPRGYWYQSEDNEDPLAMLTDEVSRKVLSPATVMKLAGINCPDDWALHTHPEDDARLAFELAVNLQLLPDCVDASKFKAKFPAIPKPKVLAAK